MELTPEEQAAVEKMRVDERTASEMAGVRWMPIQAADITAARAVEFTIAIHKMALAHFNDSVLGYACGVECNCSHYIFEAAMGILAPVGDTARMWAEYSARRQ